MEEVFSKIKNGDQGAFEQVFRMFYMPLCDYAVMILGDQAEAEDVVQDLFTYLWKSRQEIRVQESVKSYLFTSVRFRALNVLKHKMIERKHGASLMAFIEDLQNSDYSEEATCGANKRDSANFTCAMPDGVHDELFRREKIQGDCG